MPLEAGAPPLSFPALRATPGAGNRLSPSRWTRCGLRSGCAATRPGFPRLRLGARGCASHFGTGVLGDASHSATVYDLPVRALRLPPVRCRAAGAAAPLQAAAGRLAPRAAWRPRDRTGWRQPARGNVLRAFRVALDCLCNPSSSASWANLGQGQPSASGKPLGWSCARFLPDCGLGSTTSHRPISLVISETQATNSENTASTELGWCAKPRHNRKNRL